MKYFQQSYELTQSESIQELIQSSGISAFGGYMFLLEEMCKTAPILEIGITPIKLKKYARKTNTTADEFKRIIDACAQNNLIRADLWAEEKIVSIHELELESIKIDIKQEVGYGKHRRDVYKRDGYKCVYCGSSEDLSLDHVIPQSKGGTHDPSNLVACCFSCNAAKGPRTPKQWRGRE